MRVALLCLLFSLASFGSLVTSASLPSTCKGQQNLQPIIEYSTKTAMPIASVANGTLASVLPYGSTTPLLVLHVYGDSYSMGEAYGQLLQKEIDTLIPQAYAYFASTYKLPTWLVNGVLDLTRNTTKAFTPQHHFDFMQGVADGVAAAGGVSTYLDIWRIAMIPEAIKATCSIVGAWGPATADGGLLQLRALDWGTDGPFQQWPLLTTFHPNDGSFTYTNLSWAGLYATITGFSSSNLAVSEKVWYDYKGLDNIIGYPWTFMLQDIMRFDKDIDEALSRIGGAARTCAIWVGLGQGARPNPRNTNVTLPADFKLVGDSFQQLHIFNPENFPTYQGHDYFPNLLFVNKHVQPSGDACFNDLFHQSYGQLTPDTFIQSVTAGDQTGDMHIAVMDFDAKTMYIANAAPMPNNTPAYQNGFVQFDMEALWSTPQP